MGLKFFYYFFCIHCAYIVAIEPLWDWNECFVAHSTNARVGCNRTIMGLKSLLRSYRKQVILSCNWTIMGLKFRSVSHAVFAFWIPSCNRTIMGLKRERPLLQLRTVHLVAIEPLWDWKWDKVKDLLKADIVAIEPLWDWNSFLLSFPAPLLVGTPFSTGRGMPITCRYYHTKPQW